MNVVNSSAWLAYFADESTADFFAEAIEGAELLIVSSAFIYDVSKVFLREKGEDDAFLAIAAMQQGRMVDLDADLAIEAAAVGHEEKLALADSIIYTICEKFNATLWTQDEHFSRMPRVQYMEKKKSGH